MQFGRFDRKPELAYGGIDFGKCGQGRRHVFGRRQERRHSVAMQVRDGGRTLNAVIVGSPNVNPGYVLVGNRNYPQIAGDYVKTFALLKALPVDLFLGAHGAYFNMKDKLPKMSAGGPNVFIDPAGYKAYVAEREQAFE